MIKGLTFQLLDTESSAIAIHSNYYLLESERDMALQAVLNAVCFTEFEIETSGEPGSLSFALKDSNQEPVRIFLNSAHTYPDRFAANMAFDKVVELAKRPANYILLDNYGFALQDLNGEIIANHPTNYASNQERNAAINLIIAYVREDAPQHEIENTSGAFFVEVLDNQDRVLLQGTQILTLKEQIPTETHQIIEASGKPHNYLKTADGHPSCPYGFALVNHEGKIIAKHPNQYTSDLERDQTLFSVFAYLTDGEKLIPEVVQPKLSYFFDFLDEEGQVIFKSANYYESERDALDAFYLLFPSAYSSENYQIVQEGSDEFKFQIHLDGVAFAISESSFSNEEEVLLAIQQTIIHLRLSAINFETSFSPEEGYTFDILNAENIPVLKSIDSYENEGTLNEALIDTFDRAKSIENYSYINDEEACKYSFVLLDLDGNPVAIHPIHYETANERDEAVQNLIFYFTGLSPQVVLGNEIASYFYQISNFSGNVLIRSYRTDFSTEEEALSHYKTEFLPFAKLQASYSLIYDDQRCAFSFELLNDEGAVVGVNNIENNFFKDREERDLTIRLIIQLLCPFEIKNAVHGDGCGYYYQLKFEGKTFLQSNSYFPDEKSAQKTCNIDSAFLKEVTNYQITQQADGTALLEVTNDEGGIILSSPTQFNDIVSAETERDAFIAVLNQPLELDYNLQFKPRSYQCRIVNNGTTYLESSTHNPFTVFFQWPRVFSSTKERDEQIRVFVEYIEEEFRSDLDQDIEMNENGQYYFKIDFKEIRIQSFQLYSTREEAESDYKQITQLRDPGSDFIKRIDDRQNSIYGFELIDTNDQQKAKKSACGHCNRLLELAENSENYCRLTDVDACFYSYDLVDEEGNILAKHPDFYSRQEEREDAILQLIQFTNAEGMHLVEHLLLRPQSNSGKTETSYYFEVKNNEEPLVQGIQYFADRHKVDASLQQTQSILQTFGGPETKEPFRLVNSDGETVTKEVSSFYLEIINPSKNGADIPILARSLRCLNDEKYIVFHLKLTNNGTEEVRETVVKDLLPSGYQYYNHFGNGAYNDFTGIWKIEDLQPEQIVELFIWAKALDEGDFNNEASIQSTSGEIANLELRVIEDQKTELEYFKESLLFHANQLSQEEFVDKFLIEQVLSTEEEMDQLLPVARDCIDSTLALTPSLADPYSFRATVVLPYWPVRFQRPEFRTFVEHTLRREAPAHVFLRICWVDACQMTDFEKAYKNWLKAKSEGFDNCALTPAQNELIDILFNLKNIYPEATLLDCDDSSGSENPIILNHTVLGTAS